MSYSNSQCIMQNCTNNCCNYYGNCVDSQSSSSYANQCYYYYQYKETCTGICGSSSGSPSGVIWAIVGGVFGLILFSVISYVCYRRCKSKQNFVANCANGGIGGTMGPHRFDNGYNTGGGGYLGGLVV